MFDLNNYELRRKIIEDAIKPFISFFDQIDKYYFYPQIDKELIILTKHYKMLIQTNGIEQNFDLDILSREYSPCNISDLITEIERICTI